jgi:hypothetical protein
MNKPMKVEHLSTSDPSAGQPRHEQPPGIQDATKKLYLASDAASERKV